MPSSLAHVLLCFSYYFTLLSIVSAYLTIQITLKAAITQRAFSVPRRLLLVIDQSVRQLLYNVCIQ